MDEGILLALLIFVAALLYSSVGHAGASGYLAAMGLFDVPSSLMRSSALVLNVFVASIGTFRFARAGYFSWRLFLPFAITSVPMAFLGGRWRLADPAYQVLLGSVLLLAAASLLMRSFIATWVQRDRGSFIRPPPIAVALMIGAGLGLLAGMTGVGGGIFLSPLLMLMRWADAKRTAAVSAAFILVNSISGLAGQLRSGQLQTLQSHTPEVSIWLCAAIAGGLIGSWLGARRFDNRTLRILLAVVLIIAGVKMIATSPKARSADPPTHTAHPRPG